jgi:hypothetical protein
MTETTEPVGIEEDHPRTGHRPGRDPEEPRNSTVCFTVSESEKAMIDALGICTNLRRSAILTRIVTTFVAGAVAGKHYEPARRDLLAFLKKCREAVGAKPQWLKLLPSEESARTRK